MAQFDTIRYEPKLTDVAIFRIRMQGVVGSIPIVSTSLQNVRRVVVGAFDRHDGAEPPEARLVDELRV